MYKEKQWIISVTYIWLNGAPGGGGGGQYSDWAHLGSHIPSI